MHDEPAEEWDNGVSLAFHHMAELVPQRHNPQRAHGVYEQRVRAVEGMDVAGALAKLCPPPRLHRRRALQRQLEILLLPLVWRDAPLRHQAQQVAVGGDLIEAVVVDAEMGDVRRHVAPRAGHPQCEEALLAGRIELQDRRAEFEPLSPVRPAPRLIAAGDRVHRRPGRPVEAGIDRQDLAARQLPHALDRRHEVLWRDLVIDLHQASLPERWSVGAAARLAARAFNRDRK